MGAGSPVKAQAPPPTLVAVSPKKVAPVDDNPDEPEPEASLPSSTPPLQDRRGSSAGGDGGCTTGGVLGRGSAITRMTQVRPAGHAEAKGSAASSSTSDRKPRSTGSKDTADAANKELEGLLLQTNWSAIYQLFHSRFGIADLGKLDRGYVVKSAVEMTFSIVAKCFALLRSDPHGRLHCTPLHIAALQSSTEAAEVIIRDLPQLVEQTHHSSHRALCPLHIAVLSGCQGLAELLLEGRANPNVRTIHDVCPLHLAATTSKELCQILLSYSAVPHHRDVMGSNAVHYAAAFKQQPAMELLLGQSQGSQRLATDADQKRISPLHISCALYSTEQDMAGPMTLLASGAKPWQADISGASPPELVPPRSDTALQRFFETCGNRPQSAAQKWVEEQCRSAAETSDLAEATEEELPDSSAREVAPPASAPQTGLRRKSSSSQQSCQGESHRASVQQVRAEAEAERAAEMERLKRELAECREQLNAMEKLRRDLEHSQEKCAMLEQASVNQRKVFEDLQVLCDSARGQHQAQLEEMQRRHRLEREDWEERSRSRLEAAKEEAQHDAARQLELQQRESNLQREELRAQLRSTQAAVAAAEAAAADAAAAAAAEAAANAVAQVRAEAAANAMAEARAEAAAAPPSPPATTSAGEDTGDDSRPSPEVPDTRGQEFEELRQRAEDLEAEVQHLRGMQMQEQKACKQLRAQLQELWSAIRTLCAKHALRRPDEGGDANSAEASDLLGRVEAEIQRLHDVVAGRDKDVKAAKEQVRQQQEEAAELRAAAAEAKDSRAAVTLQFEEAKNKHLAQMLELQTRLKDAELDAAQTVAKAEADAEASRQRAETAEAYSQQIQPTVDRLSLQLQALEERFTEEQSLRRKYHNQIQDMKGAIRVFCRFRPLGQREIQNGDTSAVRKVDAFTVELSRHSAAHQEAKAFAFDTVFEDHSSQEEIFADCRELVQSAVDGYNATIFAYGQTGAGKTHTMYGTPDDPGLAPRSIQALFNVIQKEQRGSKTFKLKAYMVEIYKQDIIDLLSDKPGKGKSLEVKRDLGHGMVYIDGVTEREITSPEDLKSAMAEGEKKRHVTATRMNATSSRSHLLFSIIIECFNKDTQQRMHGKITLCDLAGSERPKKSEVSGDALKEAIEINKSLSALGDVIEALTKGSKSVPYRNHKLTMLMQDSLGGSAKTLMFVNCSPAASNFEETQMSLKWASRARQVMNDVKRNADSKEVARLKQVIKMMSAAQNAQEEPGAAPERKDAQDTAALRAGMGLLSS